MAPTSLAGVPVAVAGGAGIDWRRMFGVAEGGGNR
jgi:hypothetical protein